MTRISLILHGTQEAPAHFSRSGGKRLYSDETDEDFRENHNEDFRENYGEDFRENHDEWRNVRNVRVNF